MNISSDQLRTMVTEHGSVFVFGCRGPSLWACGIDSYPFGNAAWAIRSTEDELRFPGVFTTEMPDGSFTVHRGKAEYEASEFRERWMDHLAGIVEHMEPVTLPAWCFPPDCI